METFWSKPAAPLVEPAVIMPVYCDGLAEVAVVGENMHFTCYVEQPIVGSEGAQRERVVVLKFVAPISGVIPAVRMTISALTRAAIVNIPMPGWMHMEAH